jgi:ribosomal protein S18 acetylase RimI-like enzyme
MQIYPLTPNDFEPAREQLVDLLIDCVASGASVGFLPPLSSAEADAYWRTVEDALASSGDRILLVASESGEVLGTVQLDLATKANALHRAEVMKLMVHTRARGRGVGRALMQRLEQLAAAHERSLLVLDTRAGDVAEQLYLRLGYQHAGTIPHYARGADGKLHATVFMFREIPSGLDAEQLTH